MKIFYYIRRFWDIPRIEKRLFVNAIVISILYSFIVHLVPLKYYSSQLKSFKRSHIILMDKEKTFNLIRKAVNRTSIILPWNNKCLIKSIAFKQLSNKLGVNCSIAIEVFRGTSNSLNAHAYILCDNEAVYLLRKKHSNNFLHIEL
jgi:hypothetical protein